MMNRMKISKIQRDGRKIKKQQQQKQMKRSNAKEEPTVDPMISARSEGDEDGLLVQESPSLETTPVQDSQELERVEKYAEAGQGLQLALETLTPLQSTHELLDAAINVV